MSLFLINYSRQQHKLISLEMFDEKDRENVMAKRLQMELDNRDNEIVVFQADGLKELKQTHGRYFYTVEELAAKLDRAMEKGK